MSGSLQARLAWRLATVFIVALALAVGGLAWRTVGTLNSLQDRSLQAQARDLERHLVGTAGGEVRLDLPAELAATYSRWPGAYLYAVYGRDGSLRAASSPGAARLLGDQLPAAPDLGFFRIDAAAGGPYFGYATPAGDLLLVVAQSRIHDDVLIDSLVEEFVELNAWWILIVVVAALLVGVVTIRRSLAPVREVSAEAARISPSVPTIRLSEQGLPGEIRPLVHTVNLALDRLAGGLESQRRFSADAAHELRTPLAVLAARVEAIADLRQRELLERDVDRMARVLDQLLRVARLDGGGLDMSGRVDLIRIATAAAAALGPRAIAAGRTINLTRNVPSMIVRGNADMLEAALVNLIENALRHTPPGTVVEIEVSAGGRVSVLDRGPGVPEAEREVVFERFWRGAGTGAPHGAGLGLAIVAATAAAHGGRIRVGERQGGGARFTLDLAPARSEDPAAPSSDRPAGEIAAQSSFR